MKTDQCGSSSEDDDVYLNSVAVLKALKKKQTLHGSQETEEKVEEKPQELKQVIQIPEQNVKKQRPKRKTRAKRKTAGTSSSRQREEISADQDSDLEIVSVEEKSNLTAIDENDVLIVENCVDETLNSTEDENYDLSVKILWRSRNVHRLNIRKNENFQKIFEYFADLEKVSIDQILITKKDKIIKKSDTPASINLSVIDILEGGIVKKDSTTPQNNEEKDDENTCVIKVQTTTKKTIRVSVKRDENFQVLSVKCAQALDVEESKIKLYFDGELVTLTDTPDSLEIEDEACFDLKLAS